ncbi:MAG: twin-arginine translocase subunit TatC [Thaumarchaeota archaeon]|nr:twin-arginine translocase subunit TatC [Nitrososphaerota archaeon]
MSEFEEISKHLQDLRGKIIKIVLVVGIISVFILTFHATPFEFNGITLYYPMPAPFDNMAAQLTQSLKIELIPEQVQLIQTAPGQAFFAQLYISLLLGVVFGMPLIVKEAVGFLKPALEEKEIRVIRSITIPAIVLFAVGCLFSYILVIPYVLEFLYKYGESSGLITFLNIMDFVSFVLQFLLAFGISFQLPLIMYATTASGATDAKFWRRNLRYAIVVIIIFGAVITPDGSGVTMWFIAAPMIVLYLAGMFFVERKEKKIATLKS